MCGLFGWQLPGVTASDRIALATVLAMKNDKRGGDAWGYWTPGSPPVRGLDNLAGSVKAIDLAQHSTLLAHTRFATHGAADSVKNAHPFHHGSLTGAHNGVIYNAHTLDMRYPTRDFEVDSMHLFAHLAEGRNLAELEGYGAITFTDRTDEESVFLGRFQGGELSIARVQGGIVWSSERTHLALACSLAGFVPTYLGIKEGRLYSAFEGVLCKTRDHLNVRAAIRTRSFPQSDGKSAQTSAQTFRAIRQESEERTTARDLMEGWDLLNASEYVEDGEE